jgi:hypothetical protein
LADTDVKKKSSGRADSLMRLSVTSDRAEITVRTPGVVPFLRDLSARRLK